MQPSSPIEESPRKKEVDRQTVSMSDHEEVEEEGQKENKDDSVSTDSSPGGSPSAGSTTGSWHHGSYTKYTDVLRKHQRNPKGVCVCVGGGGECVGVSVCVTENHHMLCRHKQLLLSM